MKNLFFIAWLIALLVQLPTLALADDPLRDPFYTQGHSISAPDANTVSERIDPFSGILTIVHTDLHLPGNGGLDLSLIRTYNSMIWGRRDTSFPGLVAKNERSPLGIGWAMHMGIMRNPFGQGSSTQTNPDNPVFEMPDGSKHVFYKDKNDTSRFISKEFGIYKFISGVSGSGKWELTLNDGTIYTIEYLTLNGNGTVRAGYNTVNDFGTILEKIAQVTKIQNAAGTAEINISYDNHTNGYSYLSSITDSVGRIVIFHYDFTLNRLTSITTDTRTLNYGYTTTIDNSNNYLASMTPPVGNAWSYGYETASNTYELNSITYPAGGRIAYSYNDLSFATGTTTVNFRVAVGKTTYKRGGSQDGVWSYTYNTYNSGSSLANSTIISAPGVTETHTFYGWGNTGSNNVWKVGLPISSVYSGVFSESITYSWAQGTQISNDKIGNAAWVFPGGQIYDNSIYVPNLSQKDVVRDGKTYSTTYSSFNTYGDPQSISESGESGGTSRNKTLSYWTNTAKNIVKGKPFSESVTGSFAGSSSTSWTYDSNSGNVTVITKDGVTTSYVYDTAHGNHGNLYSVTDANYHTITYEWTNGRISKEANDYYFISRSINSNGTIASETDGRGPGYTTSFLYDGLLRPTSKTPPAGNPTSITYPNLDGSIRRESRGGYFTEYTFDGFGRPDGSRDSKGVTTTISYTPYGTKDFEDTNIGDKISYDYFGRVEKIQHKDFTTITYTYSTSSSTNKTTITDENTKNTELTYKAFGNPDEKYLISVYDAERNTTTYTRNIQGSLTDITQGSITRSLDYDPTKKHFLTSEYNPETGTITYGRDGVGNMTSKIDSSGTTTYVYDHINRLTDIIVTGNPAGNTITFGYDNANNQTSMTYPGGSATFRFDAINRMYEKSETIGSRSYTTNFGYDGNDNLQTITYPSNRLVTYGYNTLNQVTSISITGFGDIVTSVQHYTSGTYLGMLQSYALSNGFTTSFTYNSRNLTTAITARNVMDVRAMDIGYGYDDPRGNTTSYTNYLDTSKNQNYGHDDLNRLNSFSGAWGSGSFGYDNTGNRSTKIVGGQSTSYGYVNNRVSSTSGQEIASYSYSNEGQLSGGTWDGISHTLNYDKFDNLTSVLAGATTLASFAYDGDGQRVSKTANGKTTVYHYDLGGRVLSEDDGAGNLIADYIFLSGKLVAKVAAAPVISVTPASANFGNIYTGTTSTAQTFTVSNTGSADLVIGTLSITGTNNTEFTKNSDSCSGHTLTPSTSCSVQVSFAPSSNGAKTAYLSIPSNDPATPTANVPLSGTGTIPVPVISVTPTSAAFGNVFVGTTSTAQTLTVRNTGAADLIIGTLSITGTNNTEFTKNSDSCSAHILKPSASCSVQVSFAPSSTGAKTAYLSIPSNDQTTPTANILVNGIGILPTLAVTKTGMGTGVVTSSPPGINCGSTCSIQFTTGAQVQLTATPDANSVFDGWTGGSCTGSGTCTAAMTGNVNVTSSFSLKPTVASFSYSLSSSSAPLLATFTDSSLYATSWSWNFGDGTTSTLQNPTHYYQNPDNYTVTLTASNAASSSSATQVIPISTCTQLVKIGSTYYPTLQAAYNSLTGDQTIQALATSFPELLQTSNPFNVTLEGGYLCGFPDNPPLITTIRGDQHITTGTLRLKNIRISP